MLVSRLSTVIIPEDPAIPRVVNLVLVLRLLDLHAVSAIVWLTEENDEQAQEPAVPQPHDVIFPSEPTFDDHPIPAILQSGASSDTCTGAIEYGDSQQEVEQVAEGSERISASRKVLLG